MKQVENSFIITGFVAKDAEIRTFTNNDVARFPMAIGRKETKDNATNRVSAFINVEAWRKSGSASFELLKKGTLLTIEGYLKPEEWTDRNGVKQNGIKFVAKKFYEAVEKPEKAEKPQPKARTKNRRRRHRPLPPQERAASAAFSCSTHLGPCSF